MFTYDYLLAVTLLTTPLAADFENLTHLQRPLCAAAIQAEILDARETTILLAQEHDFEHDVEVLQERFLELFDAPRVEECRRFPGRQVVNEYLSFNRALRRDLVCQIALDPAHAEELRQVLAETDHLHHLWDMVRDARCEYYYVIVRRQALRQLRELLGPMNYYVGELPPHVPVWRLPRNN